MKKKIDILIQHIADNKTICGEDACEIPYLTGWFEEESKGKQQTYTSKDLYRLFDGIWNLRRNGGDTVCRS